jgi:isopentenyl phosphate kinase
MSGPESAAAVETVILKFGGSVITNKADNRFEVKEDVLHRLCAEIRTARETRPMRLVLVHGAGPFGHTMVTDYGIAKTLDVERGIEGFVRTHNSMQDLNYRVMCVMRDEGLLPFPVQPSASISQRNREIEWFETRVVTGLMDLDPGIVPVLYGDMVLDSAMGGSVMSGDAVVAKLAPAIGATRVLMGTDVAGIFTGDPRKNPDARLIERITADNFEEVRKAVHGSAAVDVTGGMEKKLLEIRDNLAGLEVAIFDALDPGTVQRSLLGERVGTQIAF